MKHREATFSTHGHQIIWKPRFVLIVCLKFSLFKKHAIQIFLKELKCRRHCHSPPPNFIWLWQIFIIKYETSWNLSSKNLKFWFQADQKFMSSQRRVAFFCGHPMYYRPHTNICYIMTVWYSTLISVLYVYKSGMYSIWFPLT